MTREQQSVNKELEAIQHKWLLAHKWSPDGKLWVHRKLPGLRCPPLDAMALTRADITLGWP